MHVKILILGGGITGLSTAYHLEQQGQKDYWVLEKENEPGGLCRSIRKNGFTFDYSGHLLHLHTPQGKKLVRTLLAGNLRRQTRRAWIYTENSRVPFPFQANLFALPPAIRQKCLDGLLQAKKKKLTSAPKNFEEWCLQSFGKGIYQTFLKPYNTKLWGCPPRRLTTEWCGPFIPLPSAKEICQSAVKKPNKKFGYNAHFYYPQTGGCGALTAALADSVSHLKTRCPVTQIDLSNKTVRAGGKVFSFDFLINTLPLPNFLRLLRGQPALRAQADKLAAQSVTVYQVAFQGTPKPFSWIYCPDKQDPFYRVGMQSSFSPQNAPEGCYSLYIELPGEIRPGVLQERKIEKALLKKAIIGKQDKKIFSFWTKLPQAYVLYDKRRSGTVTQVIKNLKTYHCFCAGRYGLWEYSFIEQSLLQGKEIAQKLV
ncbi:MAG: FAD-dependent oxidoreductase [Elusimicrobiaceae bacterium]|nr:FAD-dependent oxidoreductase [Elusimicrobiaceae bacterium]